MNKMEYSESFIAKAQHLLREMSDNGKLEVPFGEPFTNFSVVIGQTDKSIVAVLDIPDNLKEKIGDKAYVVTE